jgi:serine/threonine-protein kinase TNNI3K
MADPPRFHFKSIKILEDQPLGSGAYGSVYKAVCDHLPCAAKILHPMFRNTTDPGIKETVGKFRTECILLSSLQHPNVVQFLGEFNNPAKGQTALLMELMDESLTSFLEKRQPLTLPIRQLLDFSHDIALGLHYLHNNGILHRDLSSNNILLLKERTAKITDLGMSKLKDMAQMHMTQCPGSPVYMPPEALYGTFDYTEQLDCFSYGVLLIQMITCRFPQPGAHEVLVNDASSPTGFVRMPIKEVERRATDLAIIPADHFLRPFILECIADLPVNRPSSSAICQHIEVLKQQPGYTQETPQVTEVMKMNDLSLDIDEKLKEIEQLKENVQNYQEKLQQYEDVVQSKDDEIKGVQEDIEEKEKKIQEQEGNLKQLRDELDEEKRKREKIEEELLEKEKAEIERLEADEVKKENEKGGASANDASQMSDRRYSLANSPNPEYVQVINGLDPNMVNILSKNKLGELRGVLYGDPDPGSITIITSPTDPLSSRIALVMTNYRQLVNSSTITMDFVPVPYTCPKESLNDKLFQYDQNYPPCSFTFLSDLNIIQILSVHQPSLIQAKQQLEQDLKFTIFMSGKRKLCLKRADIVKEPVEILVNATNRRLQMNGGMSKMVNLASGGKVQGYCTEYIKNKGIVDECGTAKTPAGGALKCQWIIHAVGPDGTKYTQNECQLKMMDLVTKCLLQADKLGARSIAIPPIGTGHYSVNKKLAANAFITSVLDYDYLNDDTLKEIVICIIDEKTFSEFAEVFLERKADIEHSSSSSALGFHVELNDSSNVSGYPSCRAQ